MTPSGSSPSASLQNDLIARARAAKAATIDSAALEKTLRENLSGEVRFDDGSRALYAADGSSYRQVPIGVVIPRDADDVIATLSVCREFGAPLLCRGGGTSLAGQCCNVAVVMDFSKYMADILEIDPARRDSGSSAGRGRKAPPHVRPRSRNSRPLHPWRNDRQQFLRGALGHGRQN